MKFNLFTLNTSLLIALILLSGCQFHEGETDGRRLPSLILQFPESLSPQTLRYQRLTERATFLRIRVRTAAKSAAEETYEFPPNIWGKVSVPAPVLDNGKTKDVALTAEIWDKKPDGSLRGYAVLSGNMVVKADDLLQGSGRELVVKLALRVSAKEFD